MGPVDKKMSRETRRRAADEVIRRVQLYLVLIDIELQIQDMVQTDMIFRSKPVTMIYQPSHDKLQEWKYSVSRLDSSMNRLRVFLFPHFDLKMVNDLFQMYKSLQDARDAKTLDEYYPLCRTFFTDGHKLVRQMKEVMYDSICRRVIPEEYVDAIMVMERLKEMEV